MMSPDDPLINKLRAWSYRRQQLSQTASGPTDALRSGRCLHQSSNYTPLVVGSQHVVRVTPFEGDVLSFALDEHVFKSVGELWDATPIEITTVTSSH